jgi:GNAT superfamily N-acetyltransferase
VSEVLIRAARRSELTSIEDVFVSAARDGWREIFNEEQLRALPRDGLPEWDMEGVSVLVATQGRELVGFASFGPAYGEDESGALAKLYRLFVLPQVSERGVGSSLLKSSTGLLRDAGFAAAVLWVGEANGDARAFYARRGWELDGPRRSRIFLGTEFAEVRYRIALHRASR